MESQVLRIIQGSDRTIKVLLKNGNGTAFDLTDADQIKALFKQEGNQEELLEVDDGAGDSGGGSISVVGDAARGEISIALTAEDTAQLRTGSRLTWEIEIKLDGRTYITQFPEGLDVVQRLSPD